MNTTYTTHLICAPQLEGPATIGGLWVVPGEQVEADYPLLMLHSPDLALEVCAPEAGIIGDITVALHECVTPGDLLLTMEIEEKPFGWLPMVEEEPVFAPACQLAYPVPSTITTPSDTPLQITPDAAGFAARLGVNLCEVRAGQDGIINEESVAGYVRDILIRWQKIRRLLSE